MTEPSICVGDMVRIRSWQDMAEQYGLDPDGDIVGRPMFVRGMEKVCGQTVTISDLWIYHSDGSKRFTVQELPGYSFAAWMFEGPTDTDVGEFSPSDMDLTFLLG